MSEMSQSAQPAIEPEFARKRTWPDAAADGDRPLWWLVLLILSVVVYVPSLGGSFLWDDDRHVTANSTLQDTSGLHRIWTKLGMENGGTPQYYPLTHTTYWLEYRLWGNWAPGYRGVNLLIHALSGILLWEILRRLSVPGAYVAAVIFLLHPIQVESVAWITERKNVLSLLLMLAFALAYLAWAGVIRSTLGGRFLSLLDEKETETKPVEPGAMWVLGLCLVLFAAALLSKTVACVAPVCVMGILWWKRRLSLGTAWPLVLMTIAGLAMASVTGYVEKRYVGADGADWALSTLDRLSVAGSVTWFYVWKVILPFEMAFQYHRWQPQAWMAGGLVAALALAGLLWAMSGKIGRGPVVGWLIFLAGISPAMGLVNVYPMRFSWAADHFAHIGTVGLIPVIVAACFVLLRRLKPGPDGNKVLVVASSLAVAGLGVHSWMHAHNFENSAFLFDDTIRKTPTSWMGHHNYATEQIRLGTEALRIAENLEFDASRLPDSPPKTQLQKTAAEARAEFREKYDRAKQASLKTIELRPDHAGAYHTLGVIAMSEEKPAEALEYFRKSAQLWEGSRNRYPFTYELIGQILERQGNSTEAAEAYRQAVLAENPPYNPRTPTARYRLARLMVAANNLPEAERLLIEAGEINLPAETKAIEVQQRSPVLAAVPGLLADVYERQGRLREALEMQKRAATLDPYNTDILTYLGVLLGKAGDFGMSRLILEEVVKLDPGRQDAKDLLAKLEANIEMRRAATRAATQPSTTPSATEQPVTPTAP